jgi:hypothetical protein
VPVKDAQRIEVVAAPPVGSCARHPR